MEIRPDNVKELGRLRQVRLTDEQRQKHVQIVSALCNMPKASIIRALALQDIRSRDLEKAYFNFWLPVADHEACSVSPTAAATTMWLISSFGLGAAFVWAQPSLQEFVASPGLLLTPWKLAWWIALGTGGCMFHALAIPIRAAFAFAWRSRRNRSNNSMNPPTV